MAEAIDNNSVNKSPESIPWGAIFILVIGAFMAILDSSIVNVALPRLMIIFGASTDDIQWILTGYMLTSGVVIPITGYLCDRFGHKFMYIGSLISFTVGSVFCAMAWSTNSLIIARVIQAIGGGMIIPVSMALIYRIVPLKKIGMALGFWGIAAIMAPAIGPTLGGYLVDNYSWQWIFTINIPIGIIAVFLSVKFLKETPLHKKLKPDIGGMILCAISCFSLLLALSQGQDEGWSSQYIVSLFIIFFFTLIGFVLWELSAVHPMIDLTLMKNPVFTASLLATCISAIALFAVIFLIPLYAQNILGYSPMETGLMMMPMALTTGFIMPISGKLFDKYGAFELCFLGMLLVTVVTYYLHTLSLETSYHHLQLILSVRAIGLGLASMPLTTAGMNTIPKALIGRASALNNTVRQISASMGIAFLTYVLIHRQSFHMAMLNENISTGSSGATLSLAQINQYLTSFSLMGGSTQGSVSIIQGMIAKQAFINALDDTFIVSTIIVATSLPLMFFLSKERVKKERERQNIIFAKAKTVTEKQ